MVTLTYLMFIQIYKFEVSDRIENKRVSSGSSK